MAEPKDRDEKLVAMRLGRIVLQDEVDQQFIFLCEVGGERGFPIVIRDNEAREIERVVRRKDPARPLTHQLLAQAIDALGATLRSVDIVDLRENTFFARLVLSPQAGGEVHVDARPSDAIALALRARAPIRVAELVLRQACAEDKGAETEEPGEPGEHGEPGEE